MTQALRFSSGSTIEPVAKFWYLIMRRNARNFVDNFVVGSLVVDAILYLSVGCSDEFGAEYVFSKGRELCTRHIFWQCNAALRQQSLPELGETQVSAQLDHRRGFGRSHFG